MNQLYILLLALWSAFNSSDAWDLDEHTTIDSSDAWDLDEHTIPDPWQMLNESHTTFPADIYTMLFTDGETEYEMAWGTEEYEYEPESDNVPDPSITVYRPIEDSEHVIVLCKFAEMFGMTYRGSFKLSVESKLNYTIEPLEFSPLDSSEMRVFLVTVSPPASFTCVIDFDLDVRNLRSQTYNYSVSVSDHHEEGASSLYICFSSFIALGLFIMTAAVIMTNIRSKTKDTDSTAVTDNDYVEA